MAEKILQLAVESLRDKGKADSAATAAAAISGAATGTDLIERETEIPTWRQRAYNTEETPVGKPYKWDGQVYKLSQQHDATEQPDWSPDKAVSLWDICHTTDPALAKPYIAPQGTRGLWQADECCVQNGHVWKNLTENNAYGPDTMPNRWEDLGAIEEIQA